MIRTLKNPLLLLISLAGCATTGTLQTDNSTAAVRSAEELGAANVPQASLHLQLAKEEMATAQALDKDGKKAEGASFLLRAEADAELAIALSRADAQRVEAEAAMASARKLQSENPYSEGGAK